MSGSPPFTLRYYRNDELIERIADSSPLIIHTDLEEGDALATYRFESIRDSKCTGIIYEHPVIISPHPLPTGITHSDICVLNFCVAVLEGGGSFMEGKETEIKVTFTGTPPFTFSVTGNSRCWLSF